MRAVPIGPGTHRVTFTYRPTPFWVGLGISLGTLGGLGAAAMYALWGRVRRGIPAEGVVRADPLT
jgi:hypothetical protein